MTPNLDLALRALLVEAESGGELRDRLHAALRDELTGARASFERDPQSGITLLMTVRPDDSSEPILRVVPAYDERGLMASARLTLETNNVEAAHVAHND